MKQKVKVPDKIDKVLSELDNAGFSVYLVGGCVRDLLLNREPDDWDITTDALPNEIQKVFPDSVYENDFGTVGVKLRNDNSVEIVEITTLRKEAGYSDKRHPDKIEFTKKIDEDLARRDFTINAMALKYKGKSDYDLVDFYGGQKDLDKKIICAVGDPDNRFNEDALRMMRAVRFYTQLNFEIDNKTEESIKKHSKSLSDIAVERIRDEFVKIIMSDDAMRGIIKLNELYLLRQFLPELSDGIGVEQNLHHIYTVWEHNLRALNYSVGKGYSFEVRMASLLHDIGKPKVKNGKGKNATFYNHEVVGAKMVKKILERMKFPTKEVKDITHLVRQHQFNYNVGEVSEAGVRRLVKRVGIEYIDDLIKVREADRIGSGVPKAVPYKLRHLLFMIENVRKDPISPKMLKINGGDIMKITNIKPSPKIGMILNALMEDVLDDPKRNEREYLEKKVKELSKLSEKELLNISEEGKKKQYDTEKREEEKIKKKFWVK